MRHHTRKSEEFRPPRIGLFASSANGSAINTFGLFTRGLGCGGTDTEIVRERATFPGAQLETQSTAGRETLRVCCVLCGRASAEKTKKKKASNGDGELEERRLRIAER